MGAIETGDRDERKGDRCNQDGGGVLAVNALSLVRNDTYPFTVHNHWAHFPLPAGFLGGKEAVRRNDGRFEVTDFPV
jgi:hypothetical protein